MKLTYDLMTRMVNSDCHLFDEEWCERFDSCEECLRSVLGMCLTERRGKSYVVTRIPYGNYGSDDERTTFVGVYETYEEAEEAVRSKAITFVPTRTYTSSDDDYVRFEYMTTNGKCSIGRVEFPQYVIREF